MGLPCRSIPNYSALTNDRRVVLDRREQVDALIDVQRQTSPDDALRQWRFADQTMAARLGRHPARRLHFTGFGLGLIKCLVLRHSAFRANRLEYPNQGRQTAPAASMLTVADYRRPLFIIRACRKAAVRPGILQLRYPVVLTAKSQRAGSRRARSSCIGGFPNCLRYWLMLS